MNVIKRICKEREAIRLHIEVMKSTHAELRRRKSGAAKHLNDKILKAEQELLFLERNFKW
jgi:hypothetical protein